ncbi:hypothetical protein Cgig2_011481 [Carnegiea gigantea]|uniref:RNase H type-1 domain-containing protein n=1 Tax=Carnegiea gigantea TaxID=171969 RepID=A0A9Q1QQQ5_9CARY|nr:hypothetical protein Cgig2_011481 [Carnegiea gigantea]
MVDLLIFRIPRPRTFKVITPKPNPIPSSRRYTTNGLFTIHSAYHVIMEGRVMILQAQAAKGTSYGNLFGVWTCHQECGSLHGEFVEAYCQTRCSLARRIPSIGMALRYVQSFRGIGCAYPTRMPFWREGVGDEWSGHEDCIGMAMASMDKGKVGIFGAIMAGCWDARNLFIFQAKKTNPISGFHKVNTSSHSSAAAHPQRWSPPPSKILKLNFDAEVEEARSCLFTLQCAQEAGFDGLVVEGDCLQDLET